MTIQQLQDALAAATEELRALGDPGDDEAKIGRFDEITTRCEQLERDITAAKAEQRRQILARRTATPGRQATTVVPAGVVPAGAQRTKHPTPRHFGRLVAFRNQHDDAYDCGLWVKAHLRGDSKALDILESRGPDWYAEYRSQTEGVNTAGGHTVPDPLAAAIWGMWETIGVCPALCDNVPMTSDTLKWPKDISGQTVYYPSEAGSITASDMAFSQIGLTAVKRATLTKISSELFEDSAIAIAERVASRAAHALAYQMDNEFINGDGTATYGGETGLVSANSAVTGAQSTGAGNLFSELTLANFNEVMGKVPSRYWMDGDMAWIMRREYFETSARKLMYAAGGNTVTNIEGGSAPQLMGYPVYFTATMPAEANSAVAALFGNFRAACMLGRRREVSMQASEHYAFNEDVTTIRVTTRYDINVHEAAGPSGATAAGAYAALLLASS